MKIMFLFFLSGILLFFPFNCSRNMVIDCTAYQYDFSDLAGNYKASQMGINSWCESDTSHRTYTVIDSLNYFMQLNVDGTGKIYGPDTLTKFEWIVENISSTTGKNSGGCYSDFLIWTNSEKIEYRSISVNEWGLEYYINDSSWNFKDCAREKWYSFRRVN